MLAQGRMPGQGPELARGLAFGRDLMPAQGPKLGQDPMLARGPATAF